MTTAQPETTVSTWRIDPVHTSVTFAVRHLGISWYRGRFRVVEGTLRIDEAQPANSSVTASVDAASIDTTSERLQGHLLSPDFLEVEKYPAITFRSTRVEQVDGAGWRVFGDLTVKDVTRPVVLETVYHGLETHPLSKKTVAAFSAQTVIDRRDFGLAWQVPLLNGGEYLGNEVHINLEIEAVKQEQP